MTCPKNLRFMMYRESCEVTKRQSAYVILSNLGFSTLAEHVANKVLRKSFISSRSLRTGVSSTRYVYPTTAPSPVSP